jgi:hypothetical protein
MNKCRVFVEQLRDGAAPWIVQKLNDSYGNMPTDPSSFSYWVALVRFVVHAIHGPRWKIVDFLLGPSNQRVREGQAAADQERSIEAEAGCALDRSAEQQLVSVLSCGVGSDADGSDPDG